VWKINGIFSARPLVQSSGLSGAMKNINKQEFESLMVGGESTSEAVLRLEISILKNWWRRWF
jgi:hypothetical protein